MSRESGAIWQGKLFVLFAVALTMSGCASWNSIYREFNVADGDSPMVDIRQRAVLVSPYEWKATNGDTRKGTIVCAEPSPDAMASLAYELAVKGGTLNKANGEVAYAMQDGAAFTGVRTQSIQLLRDFGYRLCESYMSGGITQSQYELLLRRFQKNAVALLAIEQLTGAIKAPPIVLTSNGSAEVTRSVAGQIDLRDKLKDDIAELEKQRDALAKTRDEKKKKDKEADVSKEAEEIALLDKKITDLKKDLKDINSTLESAKGVLAGGHVEAHLISVSESSNRSDEHIKAVAGVVYDIAKDIVLSDDTTQICLSVLQSTNEVKDIYKWCVKYLNDLAQTNKERSDLEIASEKAILEKEIEILRNIPVSDKKGMDQQANKMRRHNGSYGGSRSNGIYRDVSTFYTR